MDDDDQARLARLWEQFAWAPHPRWEGARRLVWADGATLVAETDDAMSDFFERHPDFERAEPVAVTTARHALRVWLKQPDPLRPETQSGDAPPEPIVPPPLPEQIAQRPPTCGCLAISIPVTRFSPSIPISKRSGMSGATGTARTPRPGARGSG